MLKFFGIFEVVRVLRLLDKMWCLNRQVLGVAKLDIRYFELFRKFSLNEEPIKGVVSRRKTALSSKIPRSGHLRSTPHLITAISDRVWRSLAQLDCAKILSGIVLQ